MELRVQLVRKDQQDLSEQMELKVQRALKDQLVLPEQMAHKE